MGRIKKPSGRASSMLSGVALGVAAALAITLIGALVIAFLLNAHSMEVWQIGYGSMATLLVASTVGAMLATALIKHRMLVVCMLVGISYYGSLLAITALFFGGQYQGMGVTAILILGTCIAIGFIKARPRKTITKGYRKLQTG